MSNKSEVDKCFELADYLECKKKWYGPIIRGALIITPATLGLDILVFNILAHQKGEFSNATVILIGLIAALCLVLLVASIKKYILLKRLKKGLGELESFEKVIYNEVIRNDEDLSI